MYRLTVLGLTLLVFVGSASLQLLTRLPVYWTMVIATGVEPSQSIIARPGSSTQGR